MTYDDLVDELTGVFLKAEPYDIREAVKVAVSRTIGRLKENKEFDEWMSRSEVTKYNPRIKRFGHVVDELEQ